MRISTEVAAALYVLSGICQPLLVSSMKKAGLADASAQLYMFFYYAGPSLFLITFCLPNRLVDNTTPLPSLRVMLLSSLLSIFDIAAQVLNYTGAGLAGATIFAIVYSSVTVWTAVWNRIFLHRLLTTRQWTAIALVFLGLCVTAWNSTKTSKDDTTSSTATTTPVAWGTLLTLLGSCMHGGFYVMSDALMMEGRMSSSGECRHFLYPREMTALQSAVACCGLGLWQLWYTLPRWHALISAPLEAAGTTPWTAIRLLATFAAANMVHASSFYFTIANYPGKSTSAGVFKGLQAVLVFVVAHWVFCDSTPEMCWSGKKMLSLVMVVSGVILFNMEVARSKSVTTTPLRGGAQTPRYDSIDATTAMANESSSLP